ncbi:MULTISPECIES: distal tail protein Dit [Bacillus]|uniref:distal tail protein Dit n=1 Tax=Bacillus TaxID=1386 RepID=UPI0023DEE279|nr:MULTISPECIES: distal tail protein Dit [Bacillus]MDF3254998.1 phage tail family protein [Bacillus velezensis]MDF3267773.1 phage tail family protein [Bacillus velezensis]
MAEFAGIYFNELPMPSFVKVININHSILPPVSQNTLAVGGRAGVYDYGNTVGSREISIDVIIVAPEQNVLPSLLEELSAWLYYDEEKELILGDNPNRYYKAKFTGDSDIKESFLYGEGTLTFTCSDPYIYGLEREYLIPATYSGDVLELTNTGNADTYPQLRFEMTEDVTDFSIVAGEDFIDLGSPLAVDADADTKVDAGGWALKDYLKSLNGWTVPASQNYGTITGSMEVYGNVEIRQAGLDYGTGSGWHGAAVVKPLAQSVTNFEAQYTFRIDTDATYRYIGTVKLRTSVSMRAGSSTKYKVKKTGKVGETYNVLQKTGNGWYKLENGYYMPSGSKYSIFTAETYKADKMGRNQFMLNDSNGYPVFVASVRDDTSKSRRLTAEVKLINGVNVDIIFSKTVPSKHNNLDGYWLIKRNKNVWYISLYNENESGGYTRIFYYRWSDSRELYKRPVSQAQIGVMAYNSNTACYMACKDIRVKTLDTQVKEEQVPLIMRAGDVLEIDNETGAILKNGQPFYEYLNPASTFIKLRKGENGLIVTPYNSFINGTITYTERTL